MASAKGAKAQLLKVQPETTFGTTPASPSAVRMPIISSDLSTSRAQIESKVLRGRRDPARPGTGNKKSAGSIVVPVDIMNFGYWLALLMGAPTTTGSGPYTHVYQVGDAIPSCPLEQGYSDINQYQLFNGCKLNSMALNFDAAADADLDATLQFEAQKETAGTTSIDSSPDELSFERFKIGDMEIEEGGSSIAIVRSISMNINNNLDPNDFVVGGGGVRGSLPEGICSVTGNITAKFENDTLLAKARNSTESSLKMTLTSGSSSLELKINELEYGYKSPGIPGPQGVVVSLPFNAYYDNSTDETVLQATLINGQSSYSG